ncbi:MAG: hypothetical protein N3D17_07935, partial [bacterium]|nr:hypothetical protein [bacterium]
MKSNLVAVIKGNVDGYPTKQPYHPSAWYPEYRGSIISSEFNVVYDMVRNSFAYLGLDIDKYGTKKWNPLSFLINPGHIVFIKPNLISQSTDYD